jgi:hypothetical protein
VAGFVAAQRAQHQVPHATACRALGVSRAWFYKWRDGDASARHARRRQLAVEVARVFAAHCGRYGSPRITAELREAGWRVSVNTVAALMAEQGLVARPRRRRRGSTRPGRGRWRAPDLVRRDFAAAGLNQKWYGDGTEISTGEGRLFLDSVLDMGSRRIVGFALGEHHDTVLAYRSLVMAVAVRGGRDAVAGVILHTDQGSEGEIKRSSRHLERGGVGWDEHRVGRLGRRDDRRCGLRAGRRSISGIPVWRSGSASRRACRARTRRPRAGCRSRSGRAGFARLAACHRFDWSRTRVATCHSPSVRSSRC